MTLFGLMAGALCAREATAQTIDTPDLDLLMKSPPGGLQISCTPDGKVEKLAYFFDKNAVVEPLMGISQITFSKIVVMPAEKKLEYTDRVEWIPFADENIMEVVPPSHTLYWEAEKDDTLRALAMPFLEQAKDFCRDPKDQPTQHKDTSDTMLPCGLEAPVSKAAQKIKKRLGF